MDLPAGSSTVDVEIEISRNGERPGSERAGNNNDVSSWCTASAHIITAVIGSGVLSLGWAMARLGWVTGFAVMLLFAVVTYYTSLLLADCYHSGDQSRGKRSYTYMDAVEGNIGRLRARLCGFLQYTNMVCVAIGYTITAAVSMHAIRRANFFPKQEERHGNNPCKISSTPYMIIFGVAEIFFSLIPNFDQISWLSILATVMSFTYSSIGIGLGVAQVIANGRVHGSVAGMIGFAVADKPWGALQALGDIAFSYTAVLSLLSGAVSYAALGDAASDNLLAGLGIYYADSWLLHVANVAVVAHLAIAFQLCWQPLLANVEQRARESNWPLSGAVVNVPLCGGRRRPYKLSLFRLTWSTALVAATTAVPVLVPTSSLLKNLVGLLGAVAFWPLTVYFPVEMYVVEKKVPRWSMRWLSLRLLSLGCLVVTVAATMGYIAGMVS